jgi:hypothetical protein
MTIENKPEVIFDPKEVSGYLNKKGVKGLIKSWKIRFFRFENDSVSYYTNDEVNY